MTDLKPLSMGVAMAVCACLATTSEAATGPLGMVTFDGPGYVAGSIAPSPWVEQSSSTSGWGVASSVGYGGTQGLVVDYPRNVFYTLPTALTSAMGAQRLSILFDPAGATSTANFMDYGGFRVGNDNFGGTNYLGIIFRKQGAGNYGIYGPGGTPGTYMGSFTPNASPNWYELAFEINDAWDTMTLSAGPVGGSVVSMQYAWDGSDITRVRTVWGDTQFTSAPATYDNLSVVPVPEPATLILLSLGGLLLIPRRRAG